MASQRGRLRTDIHYCYHCFDWVIGGEWENHCRSHLSTMTSKRRGTITYCHTRPSCVSEGQSSGTPNSCLVGSYTGSLCCKVWETAQKGSLLALFRVSQIPTSFSQRCRSKVESRTVVQESKFLGSLGPHALD
jgi:hypothetical protein